ncbi:MAG: hypothetical protein NXI21_13360 [Alphaproteobacteria bacterium]|nr:hypothetical protein [Alphaproteobacteria bacterium]
MTLSIDNGAAPTGHETPHDRADSLQYRLLLAVCFTAFLAAALASRLMLWRWRLFGGAGWESRSVFDEALKRAHATAPYAFMC